MPTTKKRINITLQEDIEKAVENLAKRDQVPVATKVSYLVKLAIEIDEDDVLNAITEKRDTKNAKFIDHNNAW